MRHEHGEELDGSQELVIAPQAWVKPRALVVYEAFMVAVSQALKRHRSALHVAEELLETLAVLGLQAALRIH